MLSLGHIVLGIGLLLEDGGEPYYEVMGIETDGEKWSGLLSHNMDPLFYTGFVFQYLDLSPCTLLADLQQP